MVAAHGNEAQGVRGEIRVECAFAHEAGLTSSIEARARETVLEDADVLVLDAPPEPGRGRTRVIRGTWSSHPGIVAAATAIEHLENVVQADAFAFPRGYETAGEALAPDPLAMTGFEAYLHEDSGFFGEMYGYERRGEWMLMADRLRELRSSVVTAGSEGRLRMDDRRLDAWFRKIGGRFVGQTETMRMLHGTRFSLTTSAGTEWLEGAPPGNETRRQVQRAFDAFNAAAERDASADLERATLVVSTLYTALLRIHPYPDLNCRTSWVALNGALAIYGLPSVVFAQRIREHDEAIAPALRSTEPDAARPFAALLSKMIVGLRHH